MITPPSLNKNDTVGFVAPARSISQSEMKTAFEIYESWGLKIKTGKNLYNQYNQFAGTDKERAADFQEMMDDPEVKAIICARGGYGTVKIMEYLNFKNFKKNPKWIVGYSDITVLHSYLTQKVGVKTLHATMPLNMTEATRNNKSVHLLKQTLFGEKPGFEWEAEITDKNFRETEGELTGGNLSVLYSLRGTPYDIDTTNKILFLEDLDEYLYHVDRMMMNLKTGGKLSNIKALLVGGMTDMNDNTKPFGMDAKEIIKTITNDLDLTVIMDSPVGHIPENMPLVMGGHAKIKCYKDNRIWIGFTD
jgi:muramoyltetrapeptide carboxypeptidase